MIVFRGWGSLVFFVPMGWLFALAMVLVFTGYYEPDTAKVAVVVYRLGALGFALAAATLFFVVRYRNRVAPGGDEFAFVPMRYWPYVVAACAVALYVASFFNPRI